MLLFLLLFLIVGLPIFASCYFVVKQLKVQKQENFEQRTN